MSKALLFLATVIGGIGLVTSAPGLVFARSATPLDTAQIEQIVGLKGTFNKEENVFKVSKPRSDVNIAGRWLDDAAVHGAHIVGRIHPGSRRTDDAHGRHSAV